jgi:hypothetical protein
MTPIVQPRGACQLPPRHCTGAGWANLPAPHLSPIASPCIGITSCSTARGRSGCSFATPPDPIATLSTRVLASRRAETVCWRMTISARL